MKSDLEMLEETEQNLIWFAENSGKIREEFGGKAVAIKDRSIVASADTGMKLLGGLDKLGIDRSEVVVERIPNKGEIRIF
jgi:hypothetical protein